MKHINECSLMRFMLLKPRVGAPGSCIEGASNELLCDSFGHCHDVLEKCPLFFVSSFDPDGYHLVIIFLKVMIGGAFLLFLSSFFL